MRKTMRDVARGVRPDNSVLVLPPTELLLPFFASVFNSRDAENAQGRSFSFGLRSTGGTAGVSLSLVVLRNQSMPANDAIPAKESSPML
mmetsp:Transcript_3721/g.6469  ORF Transcript_3721/g.6469 Transcript_3721/m.6469 type:complete len:89 (-) Transcript_3721:42-308(-)